MKNFYSLVLSIFMMLVTACSSIPTKDIMVEADVDPTARLSGYKTYAWLGTAEIIHDPDDEWEPLAFDTDAELKFLINRELRKRGMEETTGEPDMMVGFVVGIDMENLQLQKNPETNVEMLENVPEGALLIVFIDARTGYVIWGSEATGDLQEKPTGEIIKTRLNYAVTEMFKLLPKD